MAMAMLMIMAILQDRLSSNRCFQKMLFPKRTFNTFATTLWKILQHAKEPKETMASIESMEPLQSVETMESKEPREPQLSMESMETSFPWTGNHGMHME